MSYNIFDTDKSIESLTKEFNRTQKNIIRALRTNNQKEYNRLINYRDDIRHVIRTKEKNNVDSNKEIGYYSVGRNGNSPNTSSNPSKGATE